MPLWLPSVEQWTSLLQQKASDLPIDFLKKWLTMESGGNPCSTGIPGVEAGIWQTYHPQDDKYGATFEELRAACIGGSQVQARPLTDDEKEKQMAGLGLVRQSISDAKAQLSGVGASWTGSDFWSLVKLQHGLPLVAIEMLPKVTAVLGRPPDGWDEFRDQVLAYPKDQLSFGLQRFAFAPSTQGLSSRMHDTLRNAEDAGAYGAGFGVPGNLLGPITAPGLAKVVLIALGAWGIAQVFSSGKSSSSTSLRRNPSRRRRRK